jgi:hypothetical protein
MASNVAESECLKSEFNHESHEWTRITDRGSLLLQIFGDGCELFEGGFEVLSDFFGDDVWVGKVRAVFD